MKVRDRVLVVGTDLVRHGDVAITEGLAQLAAGTAAVVHVVHVVNPKSLGHHFDQAKVLERVNRAIMDVPGAILGRLYFNAAMHDLPFPQRQVHAHVRVGEPVESLLQACADFDADCLIVGTHQRTNIERWLLGSVAEGVLRAARCPVMIARHKDYVGLERTPVPDARRDGQLAMNATEDVHTQPPTTLESWEPAGGAPTGVRIV